VPVVERFGYELHKEQILTLPEATWTATCDTQRGISVNWHI
jgi:hypothetical protein